MRLIEAAVAAAHQIAQLVGARTGQRGICVADVLTAHVAGRDHGLGVGVRAAEQLATGRGDVHGERLRAVDGRSGVEGAGGRAVAALAGYLADLAVAVAIKAHPHAATAPVGAAGGGQPDLRIVGRELQRRLEHYRRVGTARRGVKVDAAAHGRLPRVRGGAGHAERVVLGGDGQIAVAAFLDLGDAHRQLDKAQAGISQCHQVHGLEQAVTPAQPEFVEVADVQGALQLDLCDCLRHLPDADAVHLHRVGRAQAVFLDRLLVLGRGGGNVVAVGAVEVLDGHLIVGVCRALALDRDRVFRAAYQIVVVGQVIDRREVGRVAGTAPCQGLVAVGNDLELAAAPHGSAVGLLQQQVDVLAGLLLLLQHGREHDAGGAAVGTIGGRVPQSRGGEAGAVAGMGQQRGQDLAGVGIHHASGADLQQAGHLEHVVGYLGVAAQAVVGRAHVGGVAVAQGALGVLALHPCPRLLLVLAGHQRQAQLAQVVAALLVAPPAGDAGDRAMAQAHDDGGFVGVLGVLLRHSAAALATLRRARGGGDGREIGIVDQVAGDAVLSEHDRQCQAVAGLLDLQRQDALLGCADGAALATHVRLPRGCSNGLRARQARPRPWCPGRSPGPDRHG